jgi:hypothetical protein
LEKGKEKFLSISGIAGLVFLSEISLKPPQAFGNAAQHLPK